MKKNLIIFLLFFLLLLSSCLSESNSIERGKVLSVYQTKKALEMTDRVPNDPTIIMLIYDRRRVPAEWDHGITYDREHVWSERHLENDEQKQDLHNIRACTPKINNLKGSHLFIDEDSSQSFELIENDGWFFYPGDQDKGDVARIIMYMSILYELDVSEIGLDHETLIKWHEEDPVDAFETNRNEMIASESLQGNTNPFIDDEKLAYTHFAGESETNMFNVWLIGLGIFVVLLSIVSSIEDLQERAEIKRTLFTFFILFSVIWGFFWKWWIGLLILIALSMFIKDQDDLDELSPK